MINSADYESAKTSYAFDVVATDAANVAVTKSVTVNVTDVNEAPVITNTSGTGTVAENAATSTVIYAAATTADAGKTITWSLDGTDAALLKVPETNIGL